jgi:hypothetical protein
VFVPQITIFSCLIGQVTPLQLLPLFTSTCGVELVFEWTITLSGNVVATVQGLACNVVPEALPGFGTFIYTCTCITTGASISFEVTKVRRPLHCEIAGPAQVSLGASLSLDASLSFDLEGEALTCAWSCTGGLSCLPLVGTLVNFVGLLLGSYHFQLAISTADGRQATCNHDVDCVLFGRRRLLEEADSFPQLMTSSADAPAAASNPATNPFAVVALVAGVLVLSAALFLVLRRRLIAHKAEATDYVQVLSLPFTPFFHFLRLIN